MQKKEGKRSSDSYRMQNVSFRNVDEFLEFLPDADLKIVKAIRQIIFECSPFITEKLSYNVPFYHLNKAVFFIWPASILWGTKKSYKGVRLGFSKGFLINDELNYLDKGNRKQIYYRDFIDIKNIDFDLLKTYIFEALIVDKQFKKK